ncbi:ATP-binding protein [Falsochrobactrum shanghaiense]|uniref:Murein endopeptidase K n=1 Tax=Falsochrobactrum shanghaiense TaxID=2201899 RepID=A0A316J9B5_9HYPH|nr:ATP-binding protein [Falsochrobactrum shanghaiense]
MSSILTLKERFAKARTAISANLGRMGACTVATLVAAMAITAFSSSQAAAETRSLKLYYVHTGEKAEIAFKKNGRFLPDGLKRLNVFLRDWRRNEPTKMDPRLFDLVWQVYRSSGSSQYITVVSAYRSPATNNMLRSKSSGVAKKSQHTLGRAMDFFIPGVPLAKLRSIGMRYQIGGVGYYPRSGSPFVHMDVGNVRSWPRMSRRELLALFPDGQTAHIPSDGKPLPGYKQALAMIEKRKAGGGEVLMASNSSSSRKSKTLFGALFGGGADEEEDNNDVAPAAPRPARAAPARQAPAATPPAPVQQPETLIAALPTRDVPRPMAAPRPEIALAEAQQLLAQSAPAEASVVALAVPIPASKPAVAAQDPVALASAGQLAEETVAAAGSDGDAAQVADAGTAQLLTGFVPVPATRPQHEADNIQLAAVAVPSARPEGEGANASAQDAIAEIVGQAEEGASVVADADAAITPPQDAEISSAPAPAPRAQAQLAMLSPKDEIGELIGPPEDDYDMQPVAATVSAPARVQPEELAPVMTASLDPADASAAEKAKTVANEPARRQQIKAVGNGVKTGVRTTAKGARHVAKAPSRPRPVVQPAVLPASEIAMSTQSVARTVPPTNPNLRNDALRTAPTMVYMTGFQQQELPRERLHKFSGNAVTFLAVAKFSETN